MLYLFGIPFVISLLILIWYGIDYLLDEIIYYYIEK
jgi:hypothetical protein